MCKKKMTKYVKNMTKCVTQMIFGINLLKGAKQHFFLIWRSCFNRYAMSAFLKNKQAL